MQPKIFAIVAVALLAGPAEASPLGMWQKRCCCSKDTGARDYKMDCITDAWAGPSCPAGDRECNQSIFS